MAKRPNLGQISSSVFTVSQLNDAYGKIDTAFDNTLSRDGSTPNTMLADLDMNSNSLLNVDDIQAQTITVESAIIGGKEFVGTITWRASWLTGTAYDYLDVVNKDGVLYICLEAHTSDVFMTDLTNTKWEVFISNTTGPTGDPGADGTDGQGVPVGGTTGQVLAKASNADYVTEWVDASGGSSDHGTLTGLSDDDHTQYHNDSRGDARYYTKSQVDTSLSGKADTSHTHSIANVTGLQTALDGKQASGSYAASSHTHTASEVTDFSEAVDDRVSALLVAGTNITLTYNDGANTLTVAASGVSQSPILAWMI